MKKKKKNIFLILAAIAIGAGAAIFLGSQNHSRGKFMDDNVIPVGDGVGGDNPNADDQPAD